MGVTIQKRVYDLINHYGGLRSAGRSLGIDAAYLSRLKTGESKNPSDHILDLLGLEKVIWYRARYTNIGIAKDGLANSQKISK